MRCVDCYNFKQQDIDNAEFVRRFGGGEPSAIFRRKLDRNGKTTIYWCKKKKLLRKYYCKSDYLEKINLPDCKGK